MSAVRTCALESLAAAITCQIPELVDAVCIGAPPSSHEQTYPSMTINAVRWTFVPENIAELDGAPPGVLIRRVGHHDGIVQIRILATTPAQRDDLAERVANVFTSFEDEDEWPHPGTIITRITECGLIPWTASFDLDTDEWVNLDAFERKYEALLEADAFIPTLTCRTGVATIDTLQLATETSFDADTAAPVAELVRLTAAGVPVPIAA